MNYLPSLWELYRHIQNEKGTVKCMCMNESIIARAEDMKRPIPLYDFKSFGEAIKEARKKKGESRNKASSDLYISPRYLANIENKGQHPSLQVFYDLVTRYDISVDEFFFPDKSADKSTQRRQLDAMLDSMSEKGLRIVGATAKEIAEIENADDTEKIKE